MTYVCICMYARKATADYGRVTFLPTEAKGHPQGDVLGHIGSERRSHDTESPRNRQSLQVRRKKRSGFYEGPSAPYYRTLGPLRAPKTVKKDCLDPQGVL